jgi:hypothetical protein
VLVLGVGGQGEDGLLADIGHLQFPGDQPQVPGAAPPDRALGAEPDGLVGPFGVHSPRNINEPGRSCPAQITQICSTGILMPLQPKPAQNGGYLKSSADNAW